MAAQPLRPAAPVPPAEQPHPAEPPHPADANDELAAALRERELRLLLAERARRSLAAFISFTKPEYVHSAFSLAVCAALDDFLRDVRAEKRPVLVIQAPPQHGKSEIVSRRLPPYLFGHFPDLRMAACSYAADLARDMTATGSEE